MEGRTVFKLLCIMFELVTTLLYKRAFGQNELFIDLYRYKKEGNVSQSYSTINGKSFHYQYCSDLKKDLASSD